MEPASPFIRIYGCSLVNTVHLSQMF